MCKRLPNLGYRGFIGVHYCIITIFVDLKILSTDPRLRTYGTKIVSFSATSNCVQNKDDKTEQKLLEQMMWVGLSWLCKKHWWNWPHRSSLHASTQNVSLICRNREKLSLMFHLEKESIFLEILGNKLIKWRINWKWMSVSEGLTVLSKVIQLISDLALK